MAFTKLVSWHTSSPSFQSARRGPRSVRFGVPLCVVFTLQRSLIIVMYCTVQSKPMQHKPNNDHKRTADSVRRSRASKSRLRLSHVPISILVLYRCRCVRDADLCVARRCVACARLLVTSVVRTAPYSAPAARITRVRPQHCTRTVPVCLIDVLNELLSAPLALRRASAFSAT